jgi:hypothetical protein
MKGPKNSDARRAVRLRTQRFLSELIRDFSAIDPETAEADARQMMADITALPNKKKMASAFALALYDDKDNVAGMRGNANAVARFLVEIGVRPGARTPGDLPQRPSHLRRGGRVKVTINAGALADAIALTPKASKKTERNRSPEPNRQDPPSSISSLSIIDSLLVRTRPSAL